MIEQIERFHCRQCDFITESKIAVSRIKKNGICPACQNGEAKVWSATRKEWIK